MTTVEKMHSYIRRHAVRVFVFLLPAVLIPLAVAPAAQLQVPIRSGDQFPIFVPASSNLPSEVELNTGTGGATGGAGGAGGGGPGGGPAVANAGVTAGEISVGSSGSAEYSIAIVVPPGTAGMAPALSLNYSSQAGNGFIGLGWSLGGLSSVYRCSNTIIQDGKVDGVDYDSDDKFCIDGQRLVVVSGTYGGSNAEYRTEIDTFTKIVSAGAAGSGPSSFTAYTKSGQKIEYGTSADSQIRPQNQASVLVWAAKKISDTSGNYIDITYNQDTTNGTYRPTRIQYGANSAAGTPHYAAVDFEAATRTDAVPEYRSGALVKQTHRLTAIKTYNDGAPVAGTTPYVRSYAINYQSVTAQSASRVASIQECSSPTTCFPATTFAYESEGTESFAAEQTWMTDNGTFASTCQQLPFAEDRLSSLDVNDDNKADLVCAQVTNSGANYYSNVWVAKSTGTGFEAPQQWQNALLGTPVGWKTEFADMNGDGRSDIINYVIGNASGAGLVYVSLSTGTGFSAPAAWEALPAGSGLTAGWQYHFLDMDGDGRTDRVRTFTSPTGASQGTTVYVRLSNGNGFGNNVLWDYVPTGYGTGWSLGFADMNADSLPDLLKIYMSPTGSGLGAKLEVRKGTGSGFEAVSTWSNEATGYGVGWSVAFGDVNGDGNTDFLKVSRQATSTTTIVQLSTGSGLLANATWDSQTTGFSAAWRVGFTDVNGDGIDDLLKTYLGPATGPLGSKVKVRLGTGYAGFAAEQTWDDDSHTYHGWQLGYGGWQLMFGDVNGDGAADLVKYGGSGSPYPTTMNAVVATNNNKPANLVNQITDGLLKSTLLTYGWGTDSSVHEKGTGAVYPDMDVPTAARLVTAVYPAIGGVKTTYKYFGARHHLQGRGFLGFKEMLATESVTGSSTRTTYSQSYPFIGQVVATERRQANGTMMSQTSSTFAEHFTFDTSVRFPYADITTTTNYELNGSPVTKTTTNTDYDTNSSDVLLPIASRFGNATRIVSTVKECLDSSCTTGGTYTSVTRNIYQNLTSNKWHLGRLICGKVLQAHPDATVPHQTRVSGFDYDDLTGLLTKEVIEPKPGDIADDTTCVTTVPTSDPSYASLTLRTTYTNSVFGNRDKVTVVGDGVPSRETNTIWGERNTSGTLITPLNGRFAVEITNALHTPGLPQVEKRTFDGAYGAMTKLVGPNGLATTWTFDSFGRSLTETRADGTSTTVTRRDCQTDCPTGGVLAVKTVTTGQPATISYLDRDGREMRSETVGFNGHAIFVDTVYDVAGRVIRRSEPYYAGRAPVYNDTNYDLADRPKYLITRGADGQSVVTEMTYNGLTTIEKNALGQLNQQTKTARGELAKVWSAFGSASQSTITYKYDAVGNLLKTIDDAANEVVNTYDILGRKTSTVDPDMGTWTYQYDALGQITSQSAQQVAGTNLVTSTTYDLLGRQVSRTDNQGTPSTADDDAAQWVYDTAATGVGKLHKVLHGTGTGTLPVELEVTYDAFGRPSTETHTRNVAPIGSAAVWKTYTFTTTYDSSGRVAALRYPVSPHYPANLPSDPGGLRVMYSYTAGGYLDKLTNPAGTLVYWQATAQNAAGDLTQFTLGNGVKTKRIYNPYTGLVGSVSSSSDNFATNDIQGESYVFDVLGNLVSRADVRPGVSLSESFTYDGDNRVTSSTVSGQSTKNYAYDALGNITSKAGIGSYAYGAGPAGPHAVTTPGGNNNTYDLAGNQLTKSGTQGRTISYTPFNMPRRIDKQGTWVEFAYSADRSRIRHQKDTGEVLVYVDGASRFEVENLPPQAGVTTRNYTHYLSAGDETIAIYKSVGQQSTGAEAATSETMRYLHRDHLGSIAVITKDAGTPLVAERLSFDAWGTRRNASTWADAVIAGSNETRRGYTGHEQLDTVGLVHMNGRIYDPELGRFVSADPFIGAPDDPQSFNRYSYVRNNPLSMTDPSGFFFKKLFKKLFKGIKKLFKSVKAIFKAIINADFQQIAAIAAAAIVTKLTGCVECAGFISGLIGSGGDLKAGIIGAASAYAFFQVGEHFANKLADAYLTTGLKQSLSAQDAVLKFTAHGVVGGTASELSGGSFMSGFMASGSAAAARGLDIPFADGLVGTVVIGGTASLVGGGTFANGAVTGAYGFIFNDQMHITGGMREGTNPFGHTGLAVEGAGMFSYGNNTPLGSDPLAYIAGQNLVRDQLITIIPTTPQQDAAAISYFGTKPGMNSSGNFDNCSVRTSQALKVSGVPISGSGFPGALARQTSALPNVKNFYIPKGETIPQELSDIVIQKFTPMVEQ